MAYSISFFNQVKDYLYNLTPFATSIVPEFSIKKFREDPHFLNGHIRDDGLELEDGSFWRVHRSDVEKIFSWDLNSQLVVVSSNDLLNYPYKIVNISSKERPFPSIKASLEMGPCLHENPTYILNMDYLSQTITLNDGKKFQFASTELIKDWLPRDVIIIGMENSPNDSNYNRNECLLINIQMGCGAGAHLLTR